MRVAQVRLICVSYVLVGGMPKKNKWNILWAVERNAVGYLHDGRAEIEEECLAFTVTVCYPLRRPKSDSRICLIISEQRNGIKCINQWKKNGRYWCRGGGNGFDLFQCTKICSEQERLQTVWQWKHKKKIMELKLEMSQGLYSKVLWTEHGSMWTPQLTSVSLPCTDTVIRNVLHS